MIFSSLMRSTLLWTSPPECVSNVIVGFVHSGQVLGIRTRIFLAITLASSSLRISSGLSGLSNVARKKTRMLSRFVNPYETFCFILTTIS